MITKCQYKAGEVIIRENEPGDVAYVIERGQVEVTKKADGKKVHLAHIYPGETFGEMSMIDDKPRSATVIAVEDTEVRVVPHDEFFESFKTNPDVALQLLKTLFERLREAGATIAQLQKQTEEETAEFATTMDPVVPEFLVRENNVLLNGVSPQAAKNLSTNPLPITKSPFRIGRASKDPLVSNDLSLDDSVPFQVSRHHIAIVDYEGHIGVMDRGSTMGGFVDGQPFGGLEGNPGPVFFERAGGNLVLGAEQSPFRFQVTIGTQRDVPSDWSSPTMQSEKSFSLARLFHRRG